jgi:hypothetical protein
VRGGKEWMGIGMMKAKKTNNLFFRQIKILYMPERKVWSEEEDKILRYLRE